MKRPPRKGQAPLCGVIAVVLAMGSACVRFQATDPGPGVPRISNFRIDPSVVERGEMVTLRFDFRDEDGDIMDVYLGLKREVADFTFSTGLEPTLISRGRYFGQREGTVEEAITVRIERRFAPLSSQTRRFEGGTVEPEKTREEIVGIRVYEVFVIDQKEHVSNSVQARVTVR